MVRVTGVVPRIFPPILTRSLGVLSSRTVDSFLASSSATAPRSFSRSDSRSALGTGLAGSEGAAADRPLPGAASATPAAAAGPLGGAVSADGLALAGGSVATTPVVLAGAGPVLPRAAAAAAPAGDSEADVLVPGRTVGPSPGAALG